MQKKPAIRLQQKPGNRAGLWAKELTEQALQHFRRHLRVDVEIGLH
jgi:hypothetical protein